MNTDVDNAVQMLCQACTTLSSMSNDDRMQVGERLIIALRNRDALRSHSVDHEARSRRCDLETAALSIAIHAGEKQPRKNYHLDENIPF